MHTIVKVQMAYDILFYSFEDETAHSFKEKFSSTTSHVKEEKIREEKKERKRRKEGRKKYSKLAGRQLVKLKEISLKFTKCRRREEKAQF